ncbi:hypothetical protein HMPREF9269_0314 [Ligilactobacillus salivarius ACS-116-V-Col5a]|nr:hypothetical protein HMPREF9269_0314 [Ligilactobacillus salivarius ACS-116-V-Col5a]
MAIKVKKDISSSSQPKRRMFFRKKKKIYQKGSKYLLLHPL